MRFGPKATKRVRVERSASNVKVTTLHVPTCKLKYLWLDSMLTAGLASHICCFACHIITD